MFFPQTKEILIWFNCSRICIITWDTWIYCTCNPVLKDYNFCLNFQEFKDEGVRHEKIFTEGHNVPNDDVVYR